MILVIDNYDSFVFNLARYVREIGHKTHVARNDKISLDEIKKLNPSHIIISPGPCTPNEAGISLQVIQEFAPHIPILGICLGHQAIGQAFGGKVVRAKNPMHGKASLITHSEHALFNGIESPQKVGRYHSLIVDDELPKELTVIARCMQGEIMALSHCKYSVFGVQFHPESILTQHGYTLLKNFLW